MLTKCISQYLCIFLWFHFKNCNINLCIGVSVAHVNQEHVLKLLRQLPMYLIKLTSQDQKDDKVCIVGFYVMHIALQIQMLRV